MADQTDALAQKVRLGLAHQVVTLIGIPALFAMSWWGFTELTSLREDVATVKTLVHRVDRLERQADARVPGFPLSDGRALERDMNRIEGRVTALERAGQ